MIMNDRDKKYDEIFTDFFEEELDVVGLEDLHYGDAGWDSVMSMDLVETIEQEFNIKIDSEDKKNFSSYEKGKEIIEKYKTE